MSEDQEDKILNRVQKLLDKAWSTTFEEEKKSLLAKAEELMLNYSIDQLKLQDPSRATTAGSVKWAEPEIREMRAHPEGWDFEINNAIYTMFMALTRHVGARRGPSVPGQYGVYKIVGYPADLDFLQMMHQSLQLNFLGLVDPKVTPDLSWEANLIALKQVGFKWETIHYKLQDHPQYPNKGPWERNIGVRFTAIYKRYRDLNPDEPANMGSPKQWREDFMIGYCQTIANRLYEMRSAVLAENKNLPALLDEKKSQVDEFFDLQFPPPPPVPASNVPARRGRGGGRVTYRSVSTAARSAGSGAAMKVDLSGRSGRVGNGTKGEL